MRKLSPEAENILQERFGHDCVIALATCAGNIPSVRSVNAFYHNRAFYVLTYALSGKMKQIADNSTVAIAGDWFTAQGTGENLGWFCAPENSAVARRMQTVFAAWIDNGHNNFADVNTCILRIRLTSGVLLSHGTRYEIDFT